MPSRVAVYPGTFDPITNGHLDVIRRATKVADRVVIAVGEHHDKRALFSLAERLEMVKQETAAAQGHFDAVIEVQHLDTLLATFAVRVGASFVVRGLRAVSDFECELQMANMNARLAPDIETVFLMASEQNLFIASSLVREIARLGGDVSSLVSQPVAARLKTRYAELGGE